MLTGGLGDRRDDALGVVEGAKLGPQGGEQRFVLAEKGEGRLDAGIVRLMACQLEVIDGDALDVLSLIHI